MNTSEKKENNSTKVKFERTKFETSSTKDKSDNVTGWKGD